MQLIIIMNRLHKLWYMNTMGIYIPIVIMINIATYYYEIFSRIY